MQRGDQLYAIRLSGTSEVDPPCRPGTRSTQISARLWTPAAGDAEPYKHCWTARSDCSVFGAFGGMVRGASEVRSRLDWAASQYRQGHYTAYDVLAEYVGEDLGCIVALERVESRDASRNAITRERRITHVARREPEGWRIVHQHSDPLVAVTPPPT